MKVLWAIDAFEKSLKSEARIAQWIKGVASRVDLGYVASPLVSEIVLASALTEEERWSDFPMGEIRKRFERAKFPKVRLSRVTQPSLNRMAAALVTIAQKEKYDFLVMPTHSRSAIDTFFLGSFAEAVLQHSRCPVMFLPPLGELPKLKSIVFADDLEKEGDRARTQIFALARKGKFRLRHFHVAGAGYHLDLVAQKNNRFRSWVDQRMLDARLKNKITGYSALVGSGEIVSGILSEGDAADCIALVAKTGPFGAALGGSVTHRIVRRSAKPVLVVRG
jgi:nucleotide-binding universal stress UspA family protein